MLIVLILFLGILIGYSIASLLAHYDEIPCNLCAYKIYYLQNLNLENESESEN